MSEPTSAYTISDLVLEVAKESGLADYDSDGVAILPTNSHHDLNLCLGIVNRGIKMFMSDAPATGWNWMERLLDITFAPAYTGTADSGTSTTLVDTDIAGTYDDDYFNGYALKIIDGTGEDETATVTDYDGTAGEFTFSGGLSGGSTPDTTSDYRICRSTEVIDSDSGRYLLSDYFGGVAGQISYIRETNIGTDINWVDESVIREMREDLTTNGYPYMAAVRPYGTRQYELLVWPYPSAVHTVTFPYEIKFDKSIIEAGVADSGTSTTLVESYLQRYADDYFNDWVLTVVNGTGKGETATVTDFTQSSGTLEFSGGLSGSSTPDSTTEYKLEPSSNYHPAGSLFDTAILDACLAQAEIAIDDISSGYTDYYHQKSLKMAYRADAKLAPRKLGSMNTIGEPYVRYRKTVNYDTGD